MKRLKKHIFNNAEKKGKHNNCSFKYYFGVVGGSILGNFLQDKNIKLHEFYLKEILQKI